MFTFICIVGIIIVAVRFFKYYAIGRVCGNSMLPTLENNDLIIIKKEFELYENHMYLIKVDGELNYFVKRLTIIKTDKYGDKLLYFIGDNADESYDSRQFGFIHHSSVMGEVIKIWK